MVPRRRARVQVSRHLDPAGRDRIAKLGQASVADDMTLGVLQFLQIMECRKTCRVYDIAHEVDITVGATSKTVDRIEARGWCRRETNPDDRRSSLLVLTDAGRKALAAAVPTLEAAMADYVMGLPEPVLNQLAEGLGQWRRRLEQP